ncbi:DASS family sodium-coupled anion symporter [Corynebacterium felinum]|uniref:Sodium-dependent dicarboxylate transporter SdcS n=1 Tax=Corynebacterium felinum TaxID=131318 RepID=A0ABU2B759_9CORY|nr:DASS family sodium-coupled anion symporter [Corynebacterium felinum]MDF5820368.1 DASS family sodium-coupled anion symporter [Corynebacterium felinum]MDR7354440.1 sodium-dependent dicarboxylate transporter 2/3/5 [Corynebacterium felinum]WJY93809.1 Sodium-dependent dicarboxylate transporter SdcS [Corynebacterium felinum]
MSTPITHESSSHALVEDAEIRDQSEWRRQAMGMIVGLALAVLIYFIFPESAIDVVAKADPELEVSHNTLRITAAVAVLMGVWWMTEAIPLAATALVPLVAFPLLQVVEFSKISAPYASPTIFLFMGGFILALGMQRWNLHRRLALSVVLAVGTKPKQLIAGFMIATGFLSMWVSNTATAVVMLPIGVSVLQLTAESVGGMRNQKKFATGLMLAIAYSASIGSLGTIIGTPPNALLVAYMADNHDIHIGFGQWMLVGVPLAVIYMAIAWFALVTIFKPEVDSIPGGREMIREELKKMGTMRLGEVATAIIFAGAALAWVFVPLIIKQTGSDIKVADAAIGLAAAMLMFMIPADTKTGVRLMDWKTANELPWDVLLLFGGGLALSKMFSDSGLSLWIGELAKGLGTLPTILLIFAIAALVLILTEFTSNTATAATFLPIMAGVAIGIGLTVTGDQNILLLTIPVALAATCAFMLPVATPPNAIAYGSGYVKIGDMIKGGIWLNVIGMVLVTLVTYFLAVPVFGIVLS